MASWLSEQEVDSKSSIEFATRGLCVLEGAGVVKLVACRTGALAHPVKVRFQTKESGLAKAGEDYVHTEGACSEGTCSEGTCSGGLCSHCCSGLIVIVGDGHSWE